MFDVIRPSATLHDSLRKERMTLRDEADQEEVHCAGIHNQHDVGRFGVERVKAEGLCAAFSPKDN